VVEAAFSHRRKTLANAAALAGLAERGAVVDALLALGLDPAVRAEALPPEAFVALAEELVG
jgi:16S rRNA A1518/A1519 N6-dimethyltransferase RsmA/KsgA/DIM1 with predicted DNA glycosylase/AP lyase activity